MTVLGQILVTGAVVAVVLIALYEIVGILRRERGR